MKRLFFAAAMALAAVPAWAQASSMATSQVVVTNTATRLLQAQSNRINQQIECINSSAPPTALYNIFIGEWSTTTIKNGYLGAQVQGNYEAWLDIPGAYTGGLFALTDSATPVTCFVIQMYQ